MEPDELAKRLKNRKAQHYGQMAVTKMRVERHRRERQEKAVLKAGRKQKVAGPSVAAGEPAGETTITQAVSTGQEPR